jgi:hypothetical protein
VLTMTARHLYVIFLGQALLHLQRINNCDPALVVRKAETF